MKVVHLMREEKFTKPVAAFYNRYFNNGEHTLCYITKNKQSSQIDPNLSILQREFFVGKNYLINIIRFYFHVYEYDFVIFHSFLSLTAIFWGFLFLPLSFLKRVVWIEWGADLYANLNSNYHGIRKSLYDRIKKNVGYFVAIFPPDMEEYRRLYPKSKTNIFYAPYCGPEVDPYYLKKFHSSQLEQDRREGKPILIQIGQNAHLTLHHREVLDALKRFSDKNIRILLPLSYGDQDHADQVQEYAQRLFPGKVLCLREFLPHQEYFDLIEKVDIAIFNTKRQAGLGNIYRLIFANVKLYMPKDSVMYLYFKSRGVPVQAVEQLATESYDEFLSDPAGENIEKFSKWKQEISSMSWKVGAWQKVYDALKK